MKKIIKKLLNKLSINLTYFLFQDCLMNISSYLFHSKIAVKVNSSIVRNSKLKNSFKKPENLTIISYHNYKKKPLFERNMDFLGIEYVSIKAETPYFFSKKTELLYSMIKNKMIKTKYVLICDSDDVIFTKDPKGISESFEKFNCDMLFSSTKWDFVRKTTYDKGVEGYSKGYPQSLVMKDHKNWVDNVIGRKKYINCGIYMFKTDSVLDILEECLKYVSYNDPCNFEIPYGNSDQTIYRWVEPKFYPRIKVDFENKLFTHNMPEPNEIKIGFIPLKY